MKTPSLSSQQEIAILKPSSNTTSNTTSNSTTVFELLSLEEIVNVLDSYQDYLQYSRKHQQTTYRLLPGSWKHIATTHCTTSQSIISAQQLAALVDRLKIVYMVSTWYTAQCAVYQQLLHDNDKEGNREKIMQYWVDWKAALPVRSIGHYLHTQLPSILNEKIEGIISPTHFTSK